MLSVELKARPQPTTGKASWTTCRLLSMPVPANLIHKRCCHGPSSGQPPKPCSAAQPSPNSFFVPWPAHQLFTPCQRGVGAGACAHSGAGTLSQGCCLNLSSFLGKSFRLHHLGLAPFSTWHMGPASSSVQSEQLPAWLTGYVTAFRALQPHRLLPVRGFLHWNFLRSFSTSRGRNCGSGKTLSQR